MLTPLLALLLSAPQAPAPPTPLPPGCDIRVHAIDAKSGKNVVGAKIRLRDLKLSTTKAGHPSPRRPTDAAGIVCFAQTHPIADGLYINANSLIWHDQGPEMLIATRPQELTVRLRHRPFYMYFRYFLVGN